MATSMLMTARIGNVDVPMVERKEPTMIKFVEGELIEGMIVSVDRIQVKDPNDPNRAPQPARRYTLMDIESRELFTFLGTSQIDVKIRDTDKGHYLQVVYQGDSRDVIRNGRAMKLFDVRVSAKPVAKMLPGIADDLTQITDDDIPF